MTSLIRKVYMLHFIEHILFGAFESVRKVSQVQVSQMHLPSIGGMETQTTRVSVSVGCSMKVASWP